MLTILENKYKFYHLYNTMHAVSPNHRLQILSQTFI